MKNKMAASYGSGLQSPPPIGRPVDRVFEEAQFTGEIHLNGRKLRDYPKLCSKYDLSDTIHVDISRNRLTEVPHEVCDYLYVERVNCYHNVIRSIPDAIQQLQALTHLNLSRNQLTVLPTALCMLSALEVLSASNNKLVSLPEEIGELKNLMDLDVSCNEISHLPLQIGDLSSLRCLNLRKNYLVELPLEISRLQLYRLDFSSNRIEKIPTVFRKMETLEQFILDHNPLSSPPAYICTKGRQHIMKYLQIEAVKEDRKRGILMSSDSDMKRFVRKSLPPQQPSEDFKNLLGAPEAKWKRHTVLSNDSGYSTGDGAERNGWQSGEIYSLNEESDGGEPALRRDYQSHYQNYSSYYQQRLHAQQPHYQTAGPTGSSYSQVSRSRSGSGLQYQMGSISNLERNNSEPMKQGGGVVPNPVPTFNPQHHHLQHQPRPYPHEPSQPFHRPPPHPYPHSSATHPYTSNPSLYAASPSLSNRRAMAPSPAFSNHSSENQNSHNNSFSEHNNSFGGSESGSIHVRHWSNISLPEYSSRSHSDLSASQCSQSPRVPAGYRSDSLTSLRGVNKPSLDYSSNNSQPGHYSGQRQVSPYPGGNYHASPNQVEPTGSGESPPLTPPTPPIIMTGNMEDEFTRELKRQKAEYERRKKQAELIRVQQQEEEEREKEERRRAAVKLQEEQKLLMEKQEEQRRQEEMQRQQEESKRQKEEEARAQVERRKREEEEGRRREEELQSLQDTVRIPDGEDKIRMRGGELQKRTESKLADKNNMTNNCFRHTNTSTSPHSRPKQPPPPPPKSSTRPFKPPSSLPVHGFTGPLSPSSSLSSASPSSSSSSFIKSPQQRQQEDRNCILSENDYRNALSSQSFKEQRRLANSTQYRRAASDTLKKPGQPSTPQHQVDNLNYINRNGVAENSRQSSTSTTPSVSPSPSPRNSVSHLAKPNSPSSSTSHLAKPTSPSGSTSHLAKPTSTKSSVPRANGSTASAQNQAVRRTKAAVDRSNTASPVTARSSRSAGTSNLRPQGSSLNPAASNLRRSSNSSTTDDDSKPKKGPSTPTETSRLKSRFEEQNKRGAPHTTGVKKPGVPEAVDNNKRINTRPPTNMYGSGRGRSGGQKTLEDSSSNFTIRRREEQQREEAEQMDRLRQTVESRLRVTLPDNLAEALRDGVVLCHLANQIRPRSVGSIHVPSPAVPKLTLAKCRRNVDNFLDACRKIGVDQGALCDPDDIIGGLRMIPVAETVQALMEFPRLEPVDFYTANFCIAVIGEQICGPQDIFDEKGISRVAITVAALVAIGTNPKQSAV